MGLWYTKYTVLPEYISKLDTKTLLQSLFVLASSESLRILYQEEGSWSTRLSAVHVNEAVISADSRKMPEEWTWICLHAHIDDSSLYWRFWLTILNAYEDFEATQRKRSESRAIKQRRTEDTESQSFLSTSLNFCNYTNLLKLAWFEIFYSSVVA